MVQRDKWWETLNPCLKDSPEQHCLETAFVQAGGLDKLRSNFLLPFSSYSGVDILAILVI